MIIEPRDRTRQPPASPLLLRSHPLAQGMAALICGSADQGVAAGGKLVASGTSTRFARSGDLTFANTALTAGAPTFGGAPAGDLSTPQIVAAGTQALVEFWYGYIGTGVATGNGGLYTYLTGNYNGTTGFGLAAAHPSAGGRIGYYDANGAGLGVRDSGVAATTNSQLPQIVIHVRRADASGYFCINGVITGSYAATTPTSDAGSYFTVGAIGRNQYAGFGREGYALLAGKIIGTAWTTAQAKEFSRNPWQILAAEPIRPWVALFSASSSTPIAAADSAAGADSLALAAAAALADAAAGTDSAALTAALALADAAAGADAVAVSMVAAVAVADSAAGSDSASIAVTLAATDGATGTDTATGGSNMPVTVADAATGSDAAAVSATVPASDAAAGADALAVAVTLALADAAVGTDTVVAAPPGTAGTGISPLPYASPYSAGGGALSHAPPAEPKRVRRLRAPTAKAPTAAPVPAPAPVPQVVVHHVAMADAARASSRMAIEGWGFDPRPVFPVPRPAVLIRTRPSTRR